MGILEKKLSANLLFKTVKLDMCGNMLSFIIDDFFLRPHLRFNSNFTPTYT